MSEQPSASTGEEAEKTQDEAMETNKDQIKSIVPSYGSTNEDSSKEVETNGSIDVDVEANSPNKPPQEEKSVGEEASRQQNNNVVNGQSNSNSNDVQQQQEQSSEEIKGQDDPKETSLSTLPPPLIPDEKKEEVNNGNQEAVAAIISSSSEQKQEQEEQKNQANETETDKPPGKQGLPKWMVQSANDTPSPSPEAQEKPEEKQEVAPTPPTKGRRGRRPAAERLATANKQQGSTAANTATKEEDTSLLQRPRRSTRSRVDYANPDPMTVVAEADDEEPGSTKRGVKKGVVAAKKPVGGAKRGRKRKIPTSGSGEDEHEDEDDDYGSKKKIKKGNLKKAGTSAVSTTGKRRGRPAGSGNKGKAAAGGKTKGKPIWRKPIENESDDDHGEVIYDDQESDKETTEEESADEKIASKPKTSPVKAAPAKSTPTPKKRGRPPGQGRQQAKAKQSKQAVTVAPNESDNKNTIEEANASADDLMEIQA